MTKNELIQQLNAIEGNPEIVIGESIDGGRFDIKEVEPALYESDGTDIYTYSIDRENEADIHDKCILLWI